MAAILEVSGLKKSYKNFELKNVSFSIYEDCITGFIGVNGAGKTTTINALLNLVHRDDGIIKFRGKDISTDEKTFKDKIGVVFDSGCFYDELTIFLPIQYKFGYEKTKFVCFLLFLSPVIIDIAKRISVPSKLVSLMQSNSGIAAAITCGCGILIWLVSFVISNKIFAKKDLI